MASIENTIKGVPALAEVTDALLGKVATDRGVTLADEYSATVKKDVDLCIADLYIEFATSPNFTDGDFSVKYPPEQLKARALAIYKKYGDANLADFEDEPVIRNRTNIW